MAGQNLEFLEKIIKPTGIVNLVEKNGGVLKIMRWLNNLVHS
jgi:hypothetical protein